MTVGIAHPLQPTMFNISFYIIPNFISLELIFFCTSIFDNGFLLAVSRYTLLLPFARIPLLTCAAWPLFVSCRSLPARALDLHSMIEPRRRELIVLNGTHNLFPLRKAIPQRVNSTPDQSICFLANARSALNIDSSPANTGSSFTAVS